MYDWNNVISHLRIFCFPLTQAFERKIRNEVMNWFDEEGNSQPEISTSTASSGRCDVHSHTPLKI